MSGGVFKGPLAVVVVLVVGVLVYRYAPVGDWAAAIMNRIAVPGPVTVPATEPLAPPTAPSDARAVDVAPAASTVESAPAEPEPEPEPEPAVDPLPESPAAPAVVVIEEPVPAPVKRAPVQPEQTKPQQPKPAPSKPVSKPARAQPVPAPVQAPPRRQAAVEPPAVASVEAPATLAPASPMVAKVEAPAQPEPASPAMPELRVLVQADAEDYAGLGEFTPQNYARVLRTELLAIARGYLGADNVDEGGSALRFRDALSDGRGGIDRLCASGGARRLLLADLTVPFQDFSSIESGFWPSVAMTAINCGDGRIHKGRKQRLEPHRLDSFAYQQSYTQHAQRFVASQAYFLKP